VASIEDLFHHFVGVVHADAVRRGFLLVEERRGPELFGQRIARFQRGPVALEVGWDAREHWLTLTYRPAGPARPAAFEWTGMLSERYDGANISGPDQARLCAALRARLQTVWSPYTGV
jgi:hypothetical protein